MTPLDRAIVDLKDAETFIRDRELDSEGAIMLFQEIMKKMFDDINVGGHVLSGEAAGQLPKNVLDEMKVKKDVLSEKTFFEGENVNGRIEKIRSWKCGFRRH